MKSETKIAIVGGGLAGLYAGRLLHAAGIEFQLFEARDRLGGRILSADLSGRPSSDGYDLGASWFWPAMQPAMAELVEGLGLPTLPQNSEGDVVVHRMAREVPQRYRSVSAGHEPQSMRIVGGTAALVRRLADQLPADRLHLGARVSGLNLRDDHVALTLVGSGGSTRTLAAEIVIAALPPRLLEATVDFTPKVAASTARHWRETPTWMAPHAKFFAFYDRPFWLAAGLSGTAQSLVGPLVEIHDATTASGAAALFGFLGVGADQRASLGEQALSQACVEQLGRLFGGVARMPITTLIKDWATDEFTATADDRIAGGHPAASSGAWVTGPWQERLVLAGSETSAVDPGYLAGAIGAAKCAAATTLKRIAHG
ncbi:MAG: FAD-dependent oxidoreductase [Geminicoccaceae bacterium]